MRPGRSARDTVRLEPFEVTETTEVASVLLEASVQDRTGRYVSGLGTGALLLSEDEVTQTIDLVRPETLPTVYTLLVDASHSMHRRMDAVRNATSKILGILRPGDKVVVAPFTTKIGAITGPTDDVRTVGDAITAIQSSGGTAILDGLSDTAKLVSGIDGRRAVVLITDGYDEDSAERVENAIAALQAAKATVYVVGHRRSRGHLAEG